MPMQAVSLAPQPYVLDLLHQLYAVVSLQSTVVSACKSHAGWMTCAACGSVLVI